MAYLFKLFEQQFCIQLSSLVSTEHPLDCVGCRVLARGRRAWCRNNAWNHSLQDSSVRRRFTYITMHIQASPRF